MFLFALVEDQAGEWVGRLWSSVSSAQFENIFQGGLRGVRRQEHDAQKTTRTTSAKRTGPLPFFGPDAQHRRQYPQQRNDYISPPHPPPPPTPQIKRGRGAPKSVSQRRKPSVRGEIPPGRSAPSGLRSAVPSAPAVGGPLPKPTDLRLRPTNARRRPLLRPAVGYPGPCASRSGCSLACARGEEPEALPDFGERLSRSAEM